MLLLDTTMSVCPMSFEDYLTMKFFLGQGRGMLLAFCLSLFFFLRMLFSFPSLFPSFAASFGYYSVLFLAIFCCTGKCKSCLLLGNYSSGFPKGFAHVQAIHCEFLLSCSICPVWKQQIPFEMKTTPLFLGCLSQGFVGAGHSGSQGQGEARHGEHWNVPLCLSDISGSHLPFPWLGLYINIYVYIFIHTYIHIYVYLSQGMSQANPEAQAV